VVVIFNHVFTQDMCDYFHGERVAEQDADFAISGHNTARHRTGGGSGHEFPPVFPDFIETRSGPPPFAFISTDFPSTVHK
jgi:hypothetical protein